MKKRKLRLGSVARHVRPAARFLLKSQLLTIFLGLAVFGFCVGLASRPRSNAVPWGELFGGMSVVSFRETPADTAARFVVELSAGGRVFRQYDIDAREFRPAPRGRDYRRNITGTRYPPLQVRGHVAYGFWLDVPDRGRRSLLPEQFDELYRSTLDFVKPVSFLGSVLGIASGYSIGYRLGTWNGSLASRGVQERVLATPGLGRAIAREAWRRVLLEPAVMGNEGDLERFASVAGTQRLYAAFFRTALADSDGFIPREAARLERTGHHEEARTMLAFAAAVRRASDPGVHLASADFAAIERWASLLDRRGHWATGSIPPAGEERATLLGTFAWYGIAPPAAGVRRVWIGPRLLVRTAEGEGFVTDDIPATSTGGPIAWRPRLAEEYRGASAMANAWLADRPEFVALVALGQRAASAAGRTGRRIAAWQHARMLARERAPHLDRARVVATTFERPEPPSVAPDTLPGDPLDRAFHTLGEDGRILLIGTDSASAEPLSSATRAVFERADALLAQAADTAANAGRDAALRRLGAENLAFDSTAGRPRASWDGVRMDLRDIAAGQALDAAADTLRALGVRGALLELSSNTVALGATASNDRWRVALRDPRERITHVGWIRLQSNEASSSAASARADSDGPLAVLVVATSAMNAQAWREELLAHSAADARRIAKQTPGLSAVLVERADHGLDVLWVEEDLARRFVLESGAATHFRVETF